MRSRYGSHALACGARVGAGSVDTPLAEIAAFDGGPVDTSHEMAAWASPSLGRPRLRTGSWAARRYPVTVARSMRTAAATRLTDQPKWPRAKTCCCFVGSKTLLIWARNPRSTALVNVSVVVS